VIKVAILRIVIHSQLHQKYHRVFICNNVRLFALVASTDGKKEREKDGHKITGERGKGKIF
jgi:hypothetical protein